MRTINKLKLLEHGIGQSDFVNKKGQKAIIGGEILIACRCGFYGGFTTGCFVCPEGDIQSCLTWGYSKCGAEDSVTCSGETGVPELEGCN